MRNGSELKIDTVKSDCRVVRVKAGKPDGHVFHGGVGQGGLCDQSQLQLLRER